MTLLKILGWLWIAIGIWWVLRPASARSGFQKRFLKWLRLALMVIMVVFATLLFAAGRELGGLWGTVLIVCGLVALLKGLFFVRGKASERLLEWWGRQSNAVYRATGVLYLLLGVALQWAEAKQ